MSVAPALALFVRGVLAAAAVTLLISQPALAIEFRSISVPAAVLYDGPSAKARKVFILNRGYPVEVLFAVDGWLKVRDAAGELAWIEEKNLSGDRMVMVKVPRAEVRKTPDRQRANRIERRAGRAARSARARRQLGAGQAS